MVTKTNTPRQSPEQAYRNSLDELQTELNEANKNLTRLTAEVDLKDAQIQELIGKVNTLANEVVFFRNIATKLSTP